MSKYNGWTNYATWRVYLEIFDGHDTDYAVDADECQEMAEELIIDTTDEGIAREYAFQFLRQVNWYEIAEHVNEANDLTGAAEVDAARANAR